MAKKRVGISLRKPPPAEAADAFVAAESGQPADTLSDARATTPLVDATRDSVVIRTSAGRELMELTVHLPPELLRRVSAYCAERDRDVSNFIADAIRAELDSKAVRPVTLREPLWAPLVRAVREVLRRRGFSFA